MLRVEYVATHSVGFQRFVIWLAETCLRFILYLVSASQRSFLLSECVRFATLGVELLASCLLPSRGSSSRLQSSRRSASVCQCRVVWRPNFSSSLNWYSCIDVETTGVATLGVGLPSCRMASRGSVASRSTHYPFLRYQPRAQICANVQCLL
jgi:hypothetical protein